MNKKRWLYALIMFVCVIAVSLIFIPYSYAQQEGVDYRVFINNLISKHGTFKTPFPRFEVYVNDVLVHTTPSSIPLGTPTVESVPNLKLEEKIKVKVGDKMRIKSISTPGSGSKIVSYDLQISKNFTWKGAEKYEVHNKGDHTMTVDLPGIWAIFLNVSDNYTNIPKFSNWSQYGNWRTTYPKPGFLGGVVVRGWYFVGIKFEVEDTKKDCTDLEYAKVNKKTCCKELYEQHYLKEGKIKVNDFLTRGEYYCCEDLPGKVSGFKNTTLYKTYCEIPKPPPPPPPNACTYKLDVDCTENCFGKTSGYVKDMGKNNNMAEWKCIFDSPKSSLPKVRNHYKYNSVDNRYCQVFCREEISYKLPANGFVVDAGQHFTVGGTESNSDWSPIMFTGYVDCRTKGNASNTIINHKQFTVDWKSANERVISTYNRYQTEKVRDISRAEARPSSQKDCNYTCDYSYVDGSCCSRSHYDRCKYGSPAIPDTCKPGMRNGRMDPCASGRPGKPDTCRGGDVCDRVEPLTPKGYTYRPTTATRGDYSARESSWCSSFGPPSSGTPSARSSYQSALQTRARLLEDITLCNTWTRNYNDFAPKVELQYEEEEYGFRFGQLPGGVLTRRETGGSTVTTYYSGDRYTARKGYTEAQIARADCADNYYYCKTNQQRYPNNDNKKYEIYKSYVYELASNVYRYVSKPQGYSSHSIPANSQYIRIGYSNLPVHYSRVAGRYEISLRYTTFGSGNKFNQYIFQKVAFPEASRQYYNCSGLYECQYQVYNDFMECDPPGSPGCRKHLGLTVVYRPISLSNPFPGENAPSSGRRRGSNWASPSDLLKITRNRGVSDPERIYFERQPMYEITLNTQSILAIRSYNRNTIGGYSDFNLTCISGQGRECKSDFIRSRFRSLFNASRCGMSTNWEQCTIEDRR